MKEVKKIVVDFLPLILFFGGLFLLGHLLSKEPSRSTQSLTSSQLSNAYSTPSSFRASSSSHTISSSSSQAEPRSSTETSSSSQEKPASIPYDQLGLLPFKGKGQFSLGELDHLGRPTGGQVQYRYFEEIPTDIPEDPKSLSKLPGFVSESYSYDGSWSGSQSLYTDGFTPFLPNVKVFDVRNLSLMTTYTYKGHVRNQDYDEDTLRFYLKPLLTWQSKHPDYFLDYKISIIYQEDELVPRQFKVQYVGLTPDGKLVPIDLGGKAVLNDQGIASLVLDNRVSQVTIDYKTGKLLSRVHPSPEELYDQEFDEVVYIPYDDTEGFYYYEHELPDDDDGNYFTLTEAEAMDQGYARGN